MVRAVVVGSANASVGMATAAEILAGDGSALDAVETATRLVEDDPSDHTVGYGGLPNVAGDVELDASIVDGTTRRAGAVGALRGYRHPISVARAVMEHLPHVLLVGEGAARFAAERGFEAEDLLAPEAEAIWRDGLAGTLDAGSMAESMLQKVARLATDPEQAAGTVNVLARDRDGRMASAASTSGWAWKYPGRLGDTPIVGAGNYADDRFGAAACTGFGELAIRGAAAHTVVTCLAFGRRLADACQEAVADLLALDDDPVVHLVALAADGGHTAVSTRPDRTYVFWEDGMAAHDEAPRAHIT